MKAALRILPAVCCIATSLHAQVLQQGAGGAPASTTDNAPAQKPQQQKNVLGDALPFMDPGSETVQWDGKMFSVTNNRVFRAMLETYLAAPEANGPDDQAYRDVLEKITNILSPNHNSGHPDLPSAVALLPMAAQYKIDNKLCEIGRAHV